MCGFDWGIDRQMKVTNGYYRELMEANGSLEAVDVYKRQVQSYFRVRVVRMWIA